MGNAARSCELCSAVTASACPCTNPPHHRAALRESSLSTPHFSFWIAYAMRVECVHFSLSPTAAAAGSADTQKLFFRWCGRSMCVCAPSLSSSLARRLATRSMREEHKLKGRAPWWGSVFCSWQLKWVMVELQKFCWVHNRRGNSTAACGACRGCAAAFHFHIALVPCQHHAFHRVYASSRNKWIKYFLSDLENSVIIIECTVPRR